MSSLILRGGWRVGLVEDVAGDQQRVDRVLGDLVQQPGQEGVVLGAAVEVVQGVAEVPVRSVQQAQAGAPGAPA